MASLGDSSSPESGMAGSINAAPIYSRVESYEAGQKKCISDVRRTFCLFVTFDLLFITMLWIIELNVRSVCVIIVDCFPLFCRADTLLLLLIQSRPTLLKTSPDNHSQTRCPLSHQLTHLLSLMPQLWRFLSGN